MARKVYFGMDECFGSDLNDPIIIALCVSCDESDARKGETLRKRRDLDRGLFRHDFLYTLVRERSKGSQVDLISDMVGRLIFEGTRRFMHRGDVLNLLFDSEFWGIEHFYIGTPEVFDSVRFIRRGDSCVPLLYRADHLASCLYTFHSSSQVSKRRIGQFRSVYPGFGERIASARVELSSKG